MIFVHDEPIPKKKAFSSLRFKKFRRGSGGRALAMALDTPRTGTRPSGDGPRCTVNRDATPPGGLSGAERQVRGQLDELCDVFRPIPPFTTAWGILLRQSSRSAQSKLDYSEKWQRTTRSVDHEVAGAWDMAGMWAGSGDSSRFAACPLAPLTSAPPSRAAHALLTTAGSCASSRLRVRQGQGDSSHLGVLSSGMVRSASMRSQHLLRRNLNLHLWIPQLVPATIKKPNRTGAIRQKGIRLLYEGELWHQYQHLACRVAS